MVDSPSMYRRKGDQVVIYSPRLGRNMPGATVVLHDRYHIVAEEGGKAYVYPVKVVQIRTRRSQPPPDITPAPPK